MCVVCTDWLKGKMTSEEALRALGELIDTDQSGTYHYYDVVDRIMDEEMSDEEPVKK